MRKLFTFTDEQWAYFSSEMKANMHKSPVAFIVQLLNQTQKRPVGRPRSRDEDDASLTADDTVDKYEVPDKFTTSPYSYVDLVGWYQMHPEAGPIPDKRDLKLHKDYKKRMGMD